MEDNDELLRQFFSEAAKQQVADDGFTNQVMQRLPLRIKWFTRLWTLACVLVAIILFVAFRGWELLAAQLEALLRAASTVTFTLNPVTLAVILFGLLFVGVGEVISTESRRL